MPNRSIVLVITCTAILLLTALSLFGTAGIVGDVARAVSAYVLVMLLPGAALCFALFRRPAVLDLVLHMLLSSPVLATAVVVIAMLAGAAAGTAVLIVLAVSAIVSMLVLLFKRALSLQREITGGQLLVLAGLAVALCAIAGYLPLSNEWWRMYSDAWFHAAIVKDMNTFGLPPEDPYFSGLPLQYMWYYHALILCIAEATKIDPLVVMPIVNMQALAGFVTATLLFSFHLAGSRRRFSRAMASVLVAVLGMNALFWLFEPLKLIRVFRGDVTGMEELRRAFPLSPFDMQTIPHLLQVYFNQVFFLDKFIVSTPFSLGLAYMAASWYASTSYLADGRRPLLALLFVSIVGMLCFHPLVGIFMLAGLAGGLLLLLIVRGLMNSYSFKRSIAVAGAALAACAVSAPYLYAIMHGKEPSNVNAFGITGAKAIGIFISCALVILLALFQVKKLARRREPQEFFLMFATLSIALASLAVNLPGANAIYKPPFFISYPLAVVGGWTLLDWSDRWHPPARRRLRSVLLFLVLLLPVNLLATLAYYNTKTGPVMSPAEKEVSAWVRMNTPRDALFIDSEDRVILLVTGPRRYYWGIQAYANLWGYNAEEMARRRHVRGNLYSNAPIDLATFETLSSIPNDLYIIVREPGSGAASRPPVKLTDGRLRKETTPPAGMEKFSEYPALFHTVFTAWPITVLHVDRAACRDWADLLIETEENQ
jgi:hypothetical protein